MMVTFHRVSICSLVTYCKRLHVTFCPLKSLFELTEKRIIHYDEYDCKSIHREGIILVGQKELIERIAAKSHMSKADVATVLMYFFKEIPEAVANGEEVRIIGFGTFKAYTQPARIARNPRTGEAVPIPDTRIVKINPGRDFVRLVRQKPIPGSDIEKSPEG